MWVNMINNHIVINIAVVVKVYKENDAIFGLLYFSLCDNW